MNVLSHLGAKVEGITVEIWRIVFAALYSKHKAVHSDPGKISHFAVVELVQPLVILPEVKWPLLRNFKHHRIRHYKERLLRNCRREEEARSAMLCTRNISYT